MQQSVLKMRSCHLNCTVQSSYEAEHLQREQAETKHVAILQIKDHIFIGFVLAYTSTSKYVIICASTNALAYSGHILFLFSSPFVQ